MLWTSFALFGVYALRVRLIWVGLWLWVLSTGISS